MQTSRWRTVVVTAVAALAGVQLLAVTVAALPPQIASADVRRPAEYLDPLFTQDWRLFAPNPIGADRRFLVQGSYRDGTGTESSTWLDVTDAELGLVRRQLLGGRAGYGSLKMVLGLESWWTSLGTEARTGLESVGSADDPASPEEIEKVLLDDDTAPGVIDGYRSYDEAAVILASDILRAERPDAELVAIRYRVRAQAVTPWDDRGEDRPPATDRTVGWFEPAPRDADRSSDVADFWERHR